MAKTVQDVFDEMSDVRKDAAALLFGAIAENDDSVGGDTLVNDSQTLLDVYSSMSLTEKALVDFVAGGIEASAQHDVMSADDEFMEDFLEHYGVKGMRWGVRRQDRTVGPGKVALSKSARNTSAARREARIKVGQRVASLDEAHVAGLKSTGHRVANAFLGDKTFWKRASVVSDLSDDELCTAEEIEEELGVTIVSGTIDPNTSHLLLTTRSGAVMDVGAVGADAGTTVEWANVLNKPTTFPQRTHTHVQDTPAAVWTINHNMGFYPSVTVVDSSGSEVMGDISYVDVNTVTASFGGAFGGRAYLS